MDNKKILYNTNIYNFWKASFWGILIFIILVTIVIVLARYIDSDSFVVIGWISICTIPFLFQKKFKALFTNKINLEFDDENFNAYEFNHNDELINKTCIKWEEMDSYKFSFSSTNTEFTLNLTNGLKKHFLFTEGMSQDQLVNEKSIFSIFFYYVNYYNKIENNHHISIKPGFLTTKRGTTAILLVFCLSVFVIIMHFFIDYKTFKFSFMSLFIILGLIAKRMADLKLYKFINQLNARSPFN